MYKGGPLSLPYFICKSRTKRTRPIYIKMRTNQRQRPMNQKSKQKVNENNQWKEVFRRNLMSMER